jgi:hypothetical protein
MRVIAIVSYVKIYILFPVSFTFAQVSGGLFRALMPYVMRLYCFVCCIGHVCFEARAICLYVGAIVTELRHDLRQEWGSRMWATSGYQLQSNVSLLWKMASVVRWGVWCCVFFVLLRVIKTEYVLSDRIGKPEIFSSLVYWITLHHKLSNYVNICMFRPAPQVNCSRFT